MHSFGTFTKTFFLLFSGKTRTTFKKYIYIVFFFFNYKVNLCYLSAHLTLNKQL